MVWVWVGLRVGGVCVDGWRGEGVRVGKDGFGLLEFDMGEYDEGVVVKMR